MFAAHKIVTDAARGGLYRLATLRRRQDPDRNMQLHPDADRIVSGTPTAMLVGTNLCSRTQADVCEAPQAPLKKAPQHSSSAQDRFGAHCFAKLVQHHVSRSAGMEFIESGSKYVSTDMAAASQFDTTAKVGFLKLLCERYCAGLQPLQLTHQTWHMKCLCLQACTRSRQHLTTQCRTWS